VVRPRERYRYGARRRGAKLVPVYMVTEVFDSYAASTNIKTLRTVTVHTGTDGQVASYKPWEIGPAPEASEADPGIVAAMIQRVLLVANRTITASSWNATRYNSAAQGFEQLIDGVLYCTMVRTSLVIGNASVSYRTSFPGTPLPDTTATLSETSVISASVYDVVTVGIDLATGDISQGRAPLYSHSLSVTGATSTSYVAQYSAIYAGYKEAVVASLPAAHPFKSCGLAAWALFDNYGATAGDYSQSNSGLPLLSNPLTGSFEPFRIAHPSLFSIGNQNADARVAATFFKGYSSEADKRVYGSSYYELSDLGAEWTNCAGYGLLGAQVASTWSEYSASNLTDRAELLDLSGLSEPDQLAMEADPSSPPLASIPSLGLTQYTTSGPVYFRESPNRPSFAYSDVTRYLNRLYWIVN
jgi:hypothetical protein